MVVGVDRQAIHVTANHNACLLLALLGTVVTQLAEALQVGGIEEQRLITSVRDDVVSDPGLNSAALRSAATTQWLGLQLIPAQLIPALGVVEVVPRGVISH
ncbi:hypothetical protein D3C79_863820 [compost metagenome]